MAKVSDYLNLRNLLAAGVMTTAVFSIAACSDVSAAKEFSRYDSSGNIVPISRVILLLDNIEECGELERLTDADQFRGIIGENVDRVVSESGLAVNDSGELSKRYTGAFTRYSGHQWFVDVPSQQDQGAIRKLRDKLVDNICNPPGQEMSFHQGFNQDNYGGNSVLKRQYTPKDLSL